METTLHMVRLVKIIWLAQQHTLRHLLVGAVVLTGLALGQGKQFSLGGSGNFGAPGSSGGVWLELGSYTTQPEQNETWLRVSLLGQNDGSLMAGLRSRQDMGLAQFTLAMGLGLRDSDIKTYKRQTDPLMTLVEMVMLVFPFKLLQAEVGLGVDFPLDELVGIHLAAYGSGSFIGGFGYGFRSGVNLRLGS